MKWINELMENEHISSPYLVSNVTKGMTNNNIPYLTIVFQDKTGTIEGKKWDATDNDREIFVAGNIVDITADVINYRTGLQLKVGSGQVIIDGFEASDFVMSAPIEKSELEKQLAFYVDSIKDAELHLLVDSIVKDTYNDLVVYPAAVRNHHEYSSGLLFHTLSMAKLADAIASLYESVDRDLLIAGVLLHDIGKIIELSGPIIARYTKEGRLIGHISIMHSLIRSKATELKISDEKRILLEHMILSHHGKHEFGSPVLPSTREALLLHMIDDMDAKMTILDKALANIDEGEFTPKIFPLDDRCFYKPKKN